MDGDGYRAPFADAVVEEFTHCVLAGDKGAGHRWAGVTAHFDYVGKIVFDDIVPVLTRSEQRGQRVAHPDRLDGVDEIPEAASVRFIHVLHDASISPWTALHLSAVTNHQLSY